MDSAQSDSEQQAAQRRRDLARADVVKRTSALGWLFFLATISGIGVATVSVGFALARNGAPHAGGTLYWLGMALLWAPVLVVAASRSFTASERLGMTMLFAVLSYGVKVFYHPLSFAFPDELQHVRSALDLVASGHLFTPNAMLPVSPYYPGLELVTTALSAATGLSITVTGFVVAGLAKLTLVGALYWLYGRVTQSSRTAMIAALVYASNPHFLFFDSIFAYQTLALPFAAIAMLLVYRWVRGPQRPWIIPLTILTFIATAVTHHVTSFALLLFLILWLVLAWWTRRPSLRLLAAVIILVIVIGAWQTVAGLPTLHYLLQPLSSITRNLMRAPGHAAATAPTHKPTWEFLVSLATVGILALTIPVGAYRLWRRRGRDTFRAALALLSLGYFVSLAMRFLPDGAELAGRAWDFLYLALAPAVALALEWLARRSPRGGGLLTASVLGVLMVGSVTMGYPPTWGRLPGPYLASAFERSIGPLDVAAAKWQDTALGAGNRVAADYMNALLSGSYGDQVPVVGAWPVFLTPRIGPKQWQLLHYLNVHYVVVDMRLCHYLPMRGYYFVHNEPGANHYTKPLNCALLTKFDHDPRFARIFDNGTIHIYAVRSRP